MRPRTSILTVFVLAVCSGVFAATESPCVFEALSPKASFSELQERIWSRVGQHYSESILAESDLKTLAEMEAPDSKVGIETAKGVIRRLPPGASFSINERLLRASAEVILAKDPDGLTRVLETLSEGKQPPLPPAFLIPLLLKLSDSEGKRPAAIPIKSYGPNPSLTAAVFAGDHFLRKLYQKEIAKYNSLQGNGDLAKLSLEHLKRAHEVAQIRRRHFERLRARGLSWKMKMEEKGTPIERDFLEFCLQQENSLRRLIENEQFRVHWMPVESKAFPIAPSPRISRWRYLLAPFFFLQ